MKAFFAISNELQTQPCIDKFVAPYNPCLYLIVVIIQYLASAHANRLPLHGTSINPSPDYEGLLLTRAGDDASKPLFDSIEDKIEKPLVVEVASFQEYPASNDETYNCRLQIFVVFI